MKRTLISLALVLALAGCGTTDADGAGSTEWRYESGDGKTYTAEQTPKRIIAHAYSAAALMEYGIKPVAVWADMKIADDPGLQGVDFSGIAVLGQQWGKIDVEKAASLRPDLIVGDWWPVDGVYSGLEEGVEKSSHKLTKLAPVVGPAQGESIVDLIHGYEGLAASLGADITDGPGAEAKDEFAKARDAFKAAVAAKPGLSVLAVSPYEGKYAVAVPEHAPELLDLKSWGLDIIVPDKPDPEFPYWQTLSFENADTYQADLLLFDDRNLRTNLSEMKKQPLARTIKAWESEQYGEWPAYWLHTWSDYARELNELTALVTKADPELVEENA